MQSRTITALALAATFAAGLTGAAVAQAPTTPPAPPARPGIISRIFHRPAHPGTPTSGRLIPITGGIVGNKKTHVYHLPGDPGALPAPKNRIYFSTQAQAIAAGYHHAGQSHGRSGVTHGRRGTMTPMGAAPRQ